MSKKQKNTTTEKGLTDRQERFCQEYIIDLNATQAAIRAGFTKRSAAVTAHRLLIKANIQARISQLGRDREQRTGVTADYVISRLQKVAERCMQEEPVMVKEGGEWVESGEFKFDSSGANRSLELLGRHLGLFEQDDAAHKLTLEFGERLQQIIEKGIGLAEKYSTNSGN